MTVCTGFSWISRGVRGRCVEYLGGSFYESFMCCIIEKEFIGSRWCFGSNIMNMDIEDELFQSADVT